MENKLASIIIRTKNEEKWIERCLDKIKEQTYENYEIIIVDTGSTDSTLEIINKYPKCKFIQHNNIDYKPGKILNYGCDVADGEYLVLISAHCIPVNELWLGNLLKDFDDPMVAGVYGKQEPMDETDPFDKRDLILTFGLDKRIQWKDPFFHNANSAIRTSLWKAIKFDETATNIEDRVWAANMQNRGYCIVYEPTARVFHRHGIHQGGCKVRCEGVNAILDNFDGFLIENDTLESKKTIKDGIIAVIPFSEKINSELSFSNIKILYNNLVDDIEKVSSVKDVYLLTDSQELIDHSKSEHSFIKVPYKRDDDENLTLLSVMQEFIAKESIPCERSIFIAELIYLANDRAKYFNDLCEKYLSTDHTSAAWIRLNKNSIYKKYANEFYRFDEDIVKYRSDKAAFYESSDALGRIIMVKNIKEDHFLTGNSLILQDKKNTPIIAIYENADIDIVNNYSREMFMNVRQ